MSHSTAAQSIAARSAIASSLLPKNFLEGPGPKQAPDIRHVDWVGGGLPEYEGSYAVVIDGLFERWECEALTKAAIESNGGAWDRAMINTGMYEQEMMTDIRNSGRIILDDPAIAALLWRRIATHVPELAQEPLANKPDIMGNRAVMLGDVYQPAGLNERLRFLQYGSGEYFREHCDGSFVRPDGSERSWYTLHLYLNEKEEDNNLVGGATSFHSLRDQGPDIDVKPKVGRVLIFQHKNLVHSGQEVLSGLKLTLRTDLMFRLLEEKLPKDKRIPVAMGRR